MVASDNACAMKIIKLNLSAFERWIASLVLSRKVFGVQAKNDAACGSGSPAQEEKFAFAELMNAKDLRLDYDVTITPPKCYLQPPSETMLKFSSPADFESVFAGEKFVLLGVHPYDMAAINQMDRIFSTGEYDPHYMTRRKNAVIIGVDVQTPSKNVFAACMGMAVVKHGFDILLTKIEDDYLAEAMTATGDSLLLEAKDAQKADAASLALREKVWENNRNALRKHELRVSPKDIPALLERSYNHPVWEEKAKLCFSCGSCNLVCPTCYCFDVRDEFNWDMRGGERRRIWDGCMLKEFAAVAGGHNFRKNKAERYRHRYYRKGKYVPDKIGEISCVGCGRCITACVSKIAHPVEIFNRLLEPK